MDVPQGKGNPSPNGVSAANSTVHTLYQYYSGVFCAFLHVVV
jgi:hypothetical protein